MDGGSARSVCVNSTERDRGDGLKKLRLNRVLNVVADDAKPT